MSSSLHFLNFKSILYPVYRFQVPKEVELFFQFLNYRFKIFFLDFLSTILIFNTYDIGDENFHEEFESEKFKKECMLEF